MTRFSIFSRCVLLRSNRALSFVQISAALVQVNTSSAIVFPSALANKLAAFGPSFFLADKLLFVPQCINSQIRTRSRTVNNVFNVRRTQHHRNMPLPLCPVFRSFKLIHLYFVVTPVAMFAVYTQSSSSNVYKKSSTFSSDVHSLENTIHDVAGPITY